MKCLTSLNFVCLLALLFFGTLHNSDCRNCSSIYYIFASGDRQSRSETRKANNSATSSECPGRPIGILPSDFINSWRALLMSIPDFLANSSVSPSAAFVSINPGANVLTRTPWGLTSFESPLL